MSQKMGLSIEGYQEWDFIMQHAGTSIDSLQAGMKTLANAVESGNDAFARLGISQEQIAEMNNEELFSATISALQDIDNETERTYLAGQLLGRGATELGALLNMSAEETDAMRQRVHDLGGVLSEDAVKNGAAFQDSLTDLKSAFSGAANSLASELVPNLTGLMDGITKFIADGGLQKLIDGFTTLAPVIVGATTAIIAYKAASAISGVIDALRVATEGQTIAQTLLNAVMNANPFVLVATLIAGLVAALVTLWNTNEGFREAVTKIWEAIKGVFIGAWEAIKAVWDTVVGFFTGIWDGIVGIFTGVGDWFGDKFEAAKEAVEAAWATIGEWASGAWNAIKGAFSAVGSWFSSTFENAKQGVQIAWSTIKGWASDTWNNIKNGFANVGAWFSNTFTDAKEKVKLAWNAIGDWFGGVWNNIKGVFSNAWSAFKNIGENIVNGIKQGISNMWNGLKNWFSGLWDGLVGGVKNFLGIHSPSTVFAGIGKNMALGLGEGWEDEFGDIRKDIEGSMDFGTTSVDFASSGIGRTFGKASSAATTASGAQDTLPPITIVVQSVLDGKVIGETAYQYNRNRQRAYGV